MLLLSSQALHDPILNRFHDTLSRFPPPHAPGAALLGEPPYRIGEYLVHLGYLLPRELRADLHERQRQSSSRSVPLGCLLVTQALVPAPVLTGEGPLRRTPFSARSNPARPLSPAFRLLHWVLRAGPLWRDDVSPLRRS